MTVTSRPYDHGRDYDAVGDFLVRTRGQDAGHRNWVQPRWEYMHAHPFAAELKPNFGRFGLWENDGKIVGLVHCEDGSFSYFIKRFANEELKQRILVPAIKGEKKCVICFTEDQSGSDLAGTRHTGRVAASYRRR